MSAIELKDVSKSYGARRAIDSVSLTVERGERVVLFGPSGCGKSTLLHVIAGFIPPESGEIFIDSELVATAGRTLREPEERGIGMVFQDLALWPHMTVAENIEFGLRAQRYPDAERKRRVKGMVELVGLGDYLGAKPGQLSGGEQQRVALARTLALSPPIVLMDEPLSSLDEGLNTQIRMEILRLHREIGFTLLYVTHTRTEATDLGNRTIHLQHGRIVARPPERGDTIQER
jgi:ABC-type sugar transport system ATPase subunit